MQRISVGRVWTRNWCVTLAVVLTLPITAGAEESWLSVTPAGVVSVDMATAQAPVLTVNEFGEAGLEVRAVVVGLACRTRTTKGGEFVEVNWPEASVAGRIGDPALPVVRRLFIAPPEATVTVTMHVGQPTVFGLADVGYPMPVLPVQAPVEKLPGAIERAPFDYNDSTYIADQDLPDERVTIEELGIARGQRLFLLEVSPVAYNPVAGTLTVWPEIEAQVRFSGQTDWAQELSPLPGLERILLNPGPLASAPRASGNYLIVVHSDYASGIAAFADAKQARGFDVTTWVPPSPTTTAIKDYIEGLWGTGAAPDFILLVGDTNTIPHWTGGGAGSPDTDLPYSCMDGASDWYPDIALGRFPVRSEDQLQAIVDKTFYYENGPLADPDYVMRAVFMASEDNWTVSEGTHNWVIENYMDPYEIVSDKLYCHTYSATTQQVRDSFNDGRFFGIYSGHGGTYSWADGPPFSQSDVDNLFNENMYPFVCSFACVTGTFTASECFVETWIRAPDKGALAIYGSSVNSYWTEDDVLEKRLFDAIYDEEDDVPAQVAPVWNDARMRYLAQMGSGSTTRRYFEMYNLMGDPSLFFPGAGDPLTIGFPEALPDFLAPGQPTAITVQIENGSEAYAPGSGTLHYRFDGGTFLTSMLSPLGGNLYEATLPGAACDATPEFYFSATGDGGTTIYSPEVAPTDLYVATVGTVTEVLADDFETDQGWTVEDIDLITGSWERGVPAGDGTRGDPLTDFDGSGQCYLTGNALGNSDVDGGPTRLLSPTLDVSGRSDAVLRYARWLTCDDDLPPAEDFLDVEVSNDDGASWTLIESAASAEGWVERTFWLADYVAPTSQVRVRFSVMDNPNDSKTEAGIDAVEILGFACLQGNGDFDGDSDVDLADFAGFQACCDGPATGNCGGAFEFHPDGYINLDDLAGFLTMMTGPVP